MIKRREYFFSILRRLMWLSPLWYLVWCLAFGPLSGWLVGTLPVCIAFAIISLAFGIDDARSKQGWGRTSWYGFTFLAGWLAALVWPVTIAVMRHLSRRQVEADTNPV